jgi:RNA polymerase sigma-70 factor, ECF subfamily
MFSVKSNWVLFCRMPRVRGTWHAERILRSLRREGKQHMDERTSAIKRRIDEDRLVAAAKCGNRDAFGELTARHASKMFHVTRLITRNREDAEDAVQESFANALVHLGSFDGRSRFSTWLTKIAINAALMKLRKNRSLREVALEEPVERDGAPPHYEIADDAPNPEQRYAEYERCRILREAIVELRPKLRATVELHHLHGSVDETAEMLGISMGAVKARLFHAKTLLRRTLRKGDIYI